jgi:hypothetical protein
MRQVMSELQAQLSITPLAGDCLFSFVEIKEAISKLKRNKKDGSVGLSSDYIINAGDECLTYIAFLFSLITVHGVFPDTFNKTCTIIPIPKRRNVNASDSANYRGIALSSIFGKIFDNVMLLRYRDKLISSELQFGFKAKHSTNHCTMILKEAIAYYVRNQSSIFAPFLMPLKRLIGFNTANCSDFLSSVNCLLLLLEY